MIMGDKSHEARMAEAKVAPARVEGRLGIISLDAARDIE